METAEQTAYNSRWNVSLALCRRTDCARKAAEMAVAARRHIGMAEVELAKLSLEADGGLAP